MNAEIYALIRTKIGVRQLIIRVATAVITPIIALELLCAAEMWKATCT